MLKELECPGQAAMLKDLSDPCHLLAVLLVLNCYGLSYEIHHRRYFLFKSTPPPPLSSFPLPTCMSNIHRDKNNGVGRSQIKGDLLDIEEFDMGYVSFQQLESI